MQRVTLWLWLALAGSVLQLVSLGSDFYIFEGERKDAWFGIPHTSDLILLSAILAVGLFVATALGRNPLSGRGVGLAVGIVGLLATLQLGYRMIAPPFGGPFSCFFYCSPSEASPAQLLIGIWIALIGCLAVAVGGLAHAFSAAARDTPARPWVASSQSGMTPWLGLAALGAVGQFVFGYTFFTFYTTIDGPYQVAQGIEGEMHWSGWLPTPHTSSLVLAITLVVVGLVWAAARGRAPLSPMALGGLIAVLGFVSASRIFYRILQSPFGSGQVEIGAGAYLSLLAAIVVIVAGIVHAVAQRDKAAVSTTSRVT